MNVTERLIVTTVWARKYRLFLKVISYQFEEGRVIFVVEEVTPISREPV